MTVQTKFIPDDNAQRLEELLKACLQHMPANAKFLVSNEEEDICFTRNIDKIISRIDGDSEDIAINVVTKREDYSLDGENKDGYLGWFAILPYEDVDSIPYNCTDNEFCNKVMATLDGNTQLNQEPVPTVEESCSEEKVLKEDVEGQQKLTDVASADNGIYKLVLQSATDANDPESEHADAIFTVYDKNGTVIETVTMKNWFISDEPVKFTKIDETTAAELMKQIDEKILSFDFNSEPLEPVDAPEEDDTPADFTDDDIDRMNW